MQQQQLQTRNVLLEKIAQLSKEQTSEEYLVWQVCTENMHAMYVDSGWEVCKAVSMLSTDWELLHLFLK